EADRTARRATRPQAITMPAGEPVSILAVEQLRQLVQREPENAEAWRDLWRLESSMQRWGGAVECLAALDRLKPKDVGIPVELGNSLRKPNRFAEAVAA